MKRLFLIGAVALLAACSSDSKSATSTAAAATTPPAATAKPTTTAKASTTVETTTTVPRTTTTVARTTTTTSAPPTTTTTTEAPTTEAPTTTEAATTTEAPAPAIVSGRGDDVIDITGLPSDVLAAHIVNSGASNFTVKLLGPDGSSLDLLVNEIGSYDGVVMISPRRSSDTAAALQIGSSGKWTVEPIQAGALRRFTDQLGGHGDDVVVYSGSNGVAHISHNGTSNFVVRAISDSPSSGLLVNEIGSYDGRVPFPSGPALVIISADGDWNLEVS